MKDSLIVLGFFVGGCLLGALGYLPVDLKFLSFLTQNK